MSKLVIIGGHDCMACKYKELCEQYNCKAKVFTQVPKNLEQKIGCPDMVVLFTNTVSHRMVNCAVAEAKRKKNQCGSLSHKQCSSSETDFAGTCMLKHSICKLP